MHVFCHVSYGLGTQACSDQQETAVWWGRSRENGAKKYPTHTHPIGPGGALDRKFRLSVSPVPQTPESRQTKEQGLPWL